MTIAASASISYARSDFAVLSQKFSERRSRDPDCHYATLSGPMCLSSGNINLDAIVVACGFQTDIPVAHVAQDQIGIAIARFAVAAAARQRDRKPLAGTQDGTADGVHRVAFDRIAVRLAGSTA